MRSILTYAKAHTAAILAVVMWLVAALHDGNISGPEWLGLPAALGIGGAVAAVPNKPKTRTHHTSPADRGSITGLVFGIPLVILCVVFAVTGHWLLFWICLVVTVIVGVGSFASHNE